MTGVTGDLFRAPKRNRHGDPVELDGVTPVKVTDKDGNAFVRTLDNIIVAASSDVRSRDHQETSDSTGTLGLIRDSGEKAKYGDRIFIDGVKYEVKTVNWDTNNPLTGTNFGRYWVDVNTRYG